MRNRLHHISLTEKNRTKIYKAIKYPNIPFDREDIYVTTTHGDRLDLLANQFYNDVKLWWIIATANDGVAGDSLFPPTGSYVRIPANYVDTLGKFINLNKTSIDTIDSNTNNISPGNSSGY